MAISATNLLQAGSTGNSPYTTGNITPTANKIIIAMCSAYNSSAIPDTMTISGCNLTWTKIGSAQATTTRVTVWWGVGNAPSTGALTIEASGAVNASWCVAELTNAHISMPIVQQVPNTATGATSITATLSAFEKATNATMGAFGCNSSGGSTAGLGGGFASVGKYWNGEQAEALLEFRNDNDTTVDATRSASGNIEIVGFEVRHINLKEINGLTPTSIKTLNGISLSSVKSINGLA
jgi:hypothetical protein